MCDNKGLKWFISCKGIIMQRIFLIFIFTVFPFAIFPGVTQNEDWKSVYLTASLSYTIGSGVTTISFGAMYSFESSISDEEMGITTGASAGIEAGFVLYPSYNGSTGFFFRVPCRIYIAGDMIPVGFCLAPGAVFSERQSFLFLDFEGGIDGLFYGYLHGGMRWTSGDRGRNFLNPMPAALMNGWYLSAGGGYPLLELKRTITVTTN